jgi:hypothetical protein
LPGTGSAIDASRVSPVTHGAFTVRLALTVFDDEAEMVADRFAATGVVVAVKLADVCPAGTDTDAGTLTPATFEDRLTFTPAEPAGALRVTLPFTEEPPVMEVGVSVTLPIVPSVETTLIVRPAETVLAEVAVTDTWEVESTVVVAMLKVAESWPAGIVSPAGTMHAGLFEDSDTTAPAEPAGDVRVTVPVVPPPPVIAETVMVRPPIVPWVDGAAGFRVSVVLTVLADVAEMVIWVELETLEVVTVNVALV